MAEASQLRPPKRTRAPGDSGLLQDIWAAVSTDEVAGRVLVTCCVTLAVGWLGLKEAIAAVIASQVVGEGVKVVVQRLAPTRRTKWLVALLLLLLQLGERAFAAVRTAFRRRSRERRAAAGGLRASAVATVAATGIAVGLITAPELALGHSLVGDRRTTLFSTEHARRPVAAPILTLPNAPHAEAAGRDGARVTFPVTADRGRIRCAPPSGALFSIGTTRVVCSAAFEGRSTSGAFDVTVTDGTPPRLALPGPIKRRVAGDGSVVSYSATARDLVDGRLAATCTPPSGSRFGLGTTRVRCSAADAAGNRETGSFVVRVSSLGVALRLSLPGNLSIAASGPRGATVAFPAFATDASGRKIEAQCSPASGSVFPIGATPVTCRASARGHTASGAFSVTVADRVPPRLELPRLIERTTKGDGAVVDYSVVARDVVDGRVSARCTPASGSSFPLGDTTVDCAVSDASGNRSSGSFVVRVTRATPDLPVLTLPGNAFREATGPKGARVTFEATARDESGASLDARCSPASGSVFPLGETTVTCTAAAPGGPAASDSFVVTVRDTTAPRLTLPRPKPVEAVGRDGATVSYTVTATDVVGGAVTPTCSRTSGSVFPIGTTTVDCTASDAARNVARGTFTVTIVDAPPTVLVPREIRVDYTTPTATPVRFGASAVDRVDGRLTPTCAPASGSSFPVGTTTVTCSVTDSGGKQAAASFPVTVLDRVAPVLRLPKSFQAWAPTNASTIPVKYTAIAVDAVDGRLAVACDPPSGASFAVGKTTTVTCTATDRSGNVARGSFAVEVLSTPG
jgi:hypothetical protein